MRSLTGSDSVFGSWDSKKGNISVFPFEIGRPVQNPQRRLPGISNKKNSISYMLLPLVVR